MALLLELLLTAAVTLLAAFLLATFFVANDPRPQPGRAAAVIDKDEEVEEERIIEVDEVKLSRERRVGVSVSEADGWVEVEKAPAVVEVAECTPEPDEEGGPLKAGPAVRAGSVLEEEEAGVGEKRCDLTPADAAAATGVVVDANPRVLVVEAVPRDVFDLAGLESEPVQDVGAKQHELGAEAAPSEIPGAEPEKQGVQVDTKTEAFEAEQQQHMVSQVSPAAEVVDAEMEETVQAVELRPVELATQTASEEIVVVLEKEEQNVEAKDNESTADSVPQATLYLPLVEKEELKVQQPVEEAMDTHEEVQSREEAKCETLPVDQHEQLVPEEELVATKTSAAEVSHEGSSSDQVVTELPVEVVTLQGPPEDDSETDMDFGEWEGIERSEVEKRFGAAAAFAASEAGAAALSKLNSDVQLQLHGLLKVAIDGPCYDSTQPLTLRPSSRAKWVAWQKLGSMNPETAMEKYMNLLSEVIPGWLGNETVDTKKNETGDVGAIFTMAATSDQQSHRGNEESIGIDEGHLTAFPNPEKGQSSNIPAE